MDGYEATKTIRKLENRQLASIPILAMQQDAPCMPFCCILLFLFHFPFLYVYDGMETTPQFG